MLTISIIEFLEAIMIGDKLKKLRISKEMSLRALAKEAGISKSTLSKIENNQSNPTSATLKKLATALNVDLKDIFEKETDKIDTPESAVEYILEQPIISEYADLNINKLTDEEKINFANDLLEHVKLLGLKYKK